MKAWISNSKSGEFAGLRRGGKVVFATLVPSLLSARSPRRPLFLAKGVAFPFWCVCFLVWVSEEPATLGQSHTFTKNDKVHVQNPKKRQF